MLDIKFIVENPDIVKKAIQDKQTEPVDVDHLIQLYEKRKKLRQELDEINAARNKAAKEQDMEAGKILKQKAADLDPKIQEVEKEYAFLMLKIPNVPSADTPVGSDESANQVMRQWGTPREFSFTPKAHWDLGKELDIIDSEKAAEVSGARFAYMKGDLARMWYAIFNFTIDTLTNVDTLKVIANEVGAKVDITPFTLIMPPVFMRTAVMNRMARLHPMDERYVFEKDDLVLVGSAEHTIGPLHMDEIIEEPQLPIRYFAYTPAFRREAGAAGKDTRGIIRLHQFDKIEMETFTLPEKSLDEQNFLVAIQEYITQKLGLPYQVILKCTMDQGTPNHRGIDIETWMSGQGVYRETHTSDLMTSYQARRLNTRVRRADGTIEPVHMNDATAVAGRTLAAIMENYQEEDGSIRIPKVLQGYMNKEVIQKV